MGLARNLADHLTWIKAKNEEIKKITKTRPEGNEQTGNEKKEREGNHHKKTEASEKENREHLTSYINVGHTRTSSSNSVSSLWRKTKTNSTTNIETHTHIFTVWIETKWN